MAGAAVVGVVLLVFWYFYSADYFFRFSLVPLLMNQFTVDGYTLFSGKHMADAANLMWLLVPGVFVLCAGLAFVTDRSWLRRPELPFLTVLTLSVVGAAFVFDPKLGMPRDWDLFAFAGVPLTVSFYHLLLSSRRNRRTSLFIAALSIALGLLVLVPRAVSQCIPEAALAHAHLYTRLDRIKSRNFSRLLMKLYHRWGHEETARELEERWQQDYPQQAWVDEARGLVKRQEYVRAMILLTQVINSAPLPASPD